MSDISGEIHKITKRASWREYKLGAMVDYLIVHTYSLQKNLITGMNKSILQQHSKKWKLAFVFNVHYLIKLQILGLEKIFRENILRSEIVNMFTCYR